MPLCQAVGTALTYQTTKGPFSSVRPMDDGLVEHPRELNKGNGLRVDAGDLWVLPACAMQLGGTGNSS